MQMGSRGWITRCALVLAACGVLAGCGLMHERRANKQAASVVDYLYPNANEAPQLRPQVTTLRPPVRVGIAFVPGGGWNAGLPEAEKLKLLERVKASFAKHEYIDSIQIIPTAYLQPKGGFTNLQQVGQMFNVEVMALLSYDQVQFTDSNALSVLYWTIVGAYVIHGNQYDIQTMVDASVFDVKSSKLLFRAPGLSHTKGTASLAGLSDSARAARTEGFAQAVDGLIPSLQSELDLFKERIKSDARFQVENRPGYKGGGALGLVTLLLLAALALLAYAKRRNNL